MVGLISQDLSYRGWYAEIKVSFPLLLTAPLFLKATLALALVATAAHVLLVHYSARIHSPIL